MRSIVLSLLFVLASPAFGAEAEAAKTAEPEKTEPSTWDKVKEKSAQAVDYTGEKFKEAGAALGTTQANRADSSFVIHGNYSVFETWVMSKYGLTAGYNLTPSSTLELEFMHGSLGFGYLGLDIAKLEEDRIGINWRYYGKRNSFNFISGIYYNRLDAYLGSDLLKSVSGNSNAKIDLLELDTIGVSWGLGNRWQTKGGFIWGADWFTVHVPVLIVKQSAPYIDATPNASDRKAAQDTFNTLKRIPEFSAIKIQLGFSW